MTLYQQTYKSVYNLEALLLSYAKFIAMLRRFLCLEIMLRDRAESNSCAIYMQKK